MLKTISENNDSLEFHVQGLFMVYSLNDRDRYAAFLSQYNPSPHPAQINYEKHKALSLESRGYFQKFLPEEGHLHC